MKASNLAREFCWHAKRNGWRSVFVRALWPTGTDAISTTTT
jgi:hypothetical protein